LTISDLGQHAGEDFQAKVLFVPQSVRPPLDDPDLGVDPFDEPQRELLLVLAVRRDPAPVPLDDRGELLEGFEPLPFQGFLPVVEESPCPPFPAVPPQLIERLFEQVGRLEPLVGGEQFLQRLAPRKGEVLPAGEQRVPLPLDERFVLPREPVVFGSTHLVECLSEMPYHVELVEENRRLGGVPLLFRGFQEGLPHVHHGGLDPLALLGSKPLVEGVHGGLGTVCSPEPDRPLPDQVRHHDPVGVPLADGHFVDPDDLRTRGAGTPELLPHVLLLQFLDRVPVQEHFLGDIPDAGGAASPANEVGEPLRVEGIVGEELQRLPLHLPAPLAQDPPDRDLQVHPRVAAGEISDETDLVVVEGSVNRSAGTTQSFFPLRSRRRMRALGSPKIPRTIETGRKPGNR